MHINDWQSIQTLWDKLNKQLDKTQRVTGALGTPRVFIKLLVELEDFLNKTLAGERSKKRQKKYRCRQDLNLRGFPQRIHPIAQTACSMIRILLLNHSDTAPSFLNFRLVPFDHRRETQTQSHEQ